MHKEIFDEHMKKVFENAKKYYETQLWWGSYLSKETFLTKILDFVKNIE